MHQRLESHLRLQGCIQGVHEGHNSFGLASECGCVESVMPIGLRSKEVGEAVPVFSQALQQPYILRR